MPLSALHNLKLITVVLVSILALSYSAVVRDSCDRVDDKKLKELQDLIDLTWKPTLVGLGADAKNLNHTSLSVVYACKIDNGPLLEKYNTKKENLKNTITSPNNLANMFSSTGPVATEDFDKSNREDRVNEYFLFHGTKSEYVNDIISSGLQKGVSGMIGAGIYTAESSTKADQYADFKGNRTPLGTYLKMLLVRVMLGNMYLCLDDDCAKNIRQLNRPPHKYHSVVWNPTDKNKLFREFVLYDTDQTYPQYLITYVRNSAAVLPTQMFPILVGFIFHIKFFYILNVY